MPWAKRLGGPGTGLFGPSAGAITFWAVQPSGLERRAGEHAGPESVGERDQQPVRAGGEDHHRDGEHNARDDAGCLLVNGVWKGKKADP